MSAVTFVDPDPIGLTWLLGELIEQNLERDPSRHGLLRPGTVVIASIDDRVATTIVFGDGSARLRTGIARDAGVVVAASSQDLFGLVAAPLRFGLPDVLAAEGRHVLGAILTRRIRVRGLLTRLLAVRRLTMLLTAT